MGMKDKIMLKQVEQAIKANCDWYEHEGVEYIPLEQLKKWLVRDMLHKDKKAKKVLKGGFRV